MIGLPFAGSGLVHGLFMGLGIAAGLLLFAFEVRRRNLRDDRLWVIAGMCLALAAIASRMGTWWQQLDPTQNEPLLQWWSDGNRSVLAALVGAWIGVLLGKRMTGYKPSTGDLFAPSVALAMAIGRIGCLLTELPGHPTGGPWGIVVTPEQAAIIGGPAGVGLHPTFAYEIIFQLVAFGVAVAAPRPPAPSGRPLHRLRRCVCPVPLLRRVLPGERAGVVRHDPSPVVPDLLAAPARLAGQPHLAPAHPVHHGSPCDHWRPP